MNIKEVDIKESIGEGAYLDVYHIEGNIGPTELHIEAIINTLQNLHKDDAILYLNDPNLCIDWLKDKFVTQLGMELSSHKLKFKKIYLLKKFYDDYGIKSICLNINY